MDNMYQIMAQEAIERKYSRKHIDGYIRAAIRDNPVNQSKVDKGVALIKDWMEGQYRPEKEARIKQLKAFAPDDAAVAKTVTDLFVGIAYVQKPQLMSSLNVQLAGRLGFDDREQAIKTVAEMLSVLCLTDAFDITKENRMASLMVVSRIELPEKVLRFIEHSEYLPPMVCEPLELENNYDSGHLTIKESLILGNGNHHDGNICLDVLNIANSVKLKLDVDFLLALEEDKSFELKSEDEFNEWVVIKKKHKQFPTYASYVAYVEGMWETFKGTSAKMYMEMVENGNEFCLTHKVDKRGRIYSQGYHINTQGNPYKKAMIDLANEEIVEGV